MTPTPDRPTVDQITSDQLDQLYRERDHAVRVARSAAFDTAKALTAQLLAEQRAKQAEATLTAVRALADELIAEGATEHGYFGDAGRRLRAVLDQHGQTPA